MAFHFPTGLIAMYQQPAFRETRSEVLHAAIRAYPLGTLVTHGASGLDANLVPFILVEADDGAVLRAHLARGNPQLEELRTGAEAMVVFHGPQAYVSPSWYPTKRAHGKVVPTWNYVVVSAWGRPRVIDDAAWKHAQISALTDQQEGGRAEPWSVTDAPVDFVAAQLNGITGVEIAVERLVGKWKASQNHTEANRRGVIEGLQEDDPASPMAAVMQRMGGET